MFFDCLFCWLSWIGSVFVFTYLFATDYSLILTINQQAWIIAVACVLFYTICGVYKSLWQHPGVGSMIRIAAAALLSSFSIYVALRIQLGFWQNPGLGMMAFYFSLTLSIALRLHKVIRTTVVQYSRRFLKMPQELQVEPVRTLLIGAGDSASAFLLNSSQHGGRPRKILGILDKDHRKHGYHLHGVSVLGNCDQIPKLVQELNIDEIIITVPSMKNEDVRHIVRLTPVNRCKVRLLAGLSSDKASDKLRDINIGDLLGRKEADLDEAVIAAWLKDKTVMVTGGGGSIGSEICRQLLAYNVKKIVIFDISENNLYNLKEELKINFKNDGRYKVAGRVGSVQNMTRLNEVFQEFKPQIVFHAAAYKHVPLMEECPRLAIENNVLGTYNAARAACRHNVERFVMISTDKAVNPTNVMGASKRMAEILTLGMNRQGGTEFVCVRFGNVLDSNGSVIPLFRRQIEAGGPVTVTHPDIIRYFMTISEAARLVLDAGAMAAGGEIFILDMGEQVRIADLAENLIRMAGLTPGVDIKIEYIGLRPGEKLYEELLLNEEGLAKTQNDKIFVARPPQSPNLALLMSSLEDEPDRGDIRKFLKQFVPEYQHDESLA
jgi:FlaA1/EpsC-like NDP-sugar epimerase